MQDISADPLGSDHIYLSVDDLTALSARRRSKSQAKELSGEVVCACNASAREAEVEGPGLQGQSGLFELCLKNIKHNTYFIIFPFLCIHVWLHVLCVCICTCTCCLCACMCEKECVCMCVFACACGG